MKSLFAFALFGLVMLLCALRVYAGGDLWLTAVFPIFILWVANQIAHPRH